MKYLVFYLIVLVSFFETSAAWGQDDLGEEQSQEKLQLRRMRDEMQGIKSEVTDAMQSLNQLGSQLLKAQDLHEVHLIAKESGLEIAPGTTISCLTYNGKLPGPVIRVHEGEMLKVVLHNQLNVPTSLIFHGVVAPHNVMGLPRQEGGLIKPGEAYAYQFIVKQAGTYFYHPQIVHADQITRGLYGALIVEPKNEARSYERDLVVVLSDISVPTGASPAKSRTANLSTAPGMNQHTLSNTTIYYLMNGKCAPSIPPIEVRTGERLRLRVINTGRQVVPLYLSGHRFEVVALNGSDVIEPHVFRDTIAVNPGDRIDLELTCDNPGVWSLGSELACQVTNNGKFPGGLACVLRYTDAGPESPSH